MFQILQYFRLFRLEVIFLDSKKVEKQILDTKNKKNRLKIDIFVYKEKNRLKIDIFV